MKINELLTDTGDYSKIVTTIANRPKRLWFVGELPPMRLPTVAIIGTRKPTAYGQEVTHRLAFELASRGVVIVSGLALGIDAIAHRGALKAGGRTIAVMAGGLDNVYPGAHRGLAAQIVTNKGALISEYPAGTTPFQSNFIARNRIVSGMSDVVIVVEATAKSGTMHTAGFALEQGRTVMAVPGNITSPASVGCNNLIKSGAHPITETADVLHELGIAPGQAALPLGANKQESLVLALLQAGVRDGDSLQKQSGLSPALFSQTLTMLEISGKIRALGGNQWAIK